MPDANIVPLAELSEAEIDAVSGGKPPFVGGLGAVFLQISANIAIGNVTTGDFSQTTGDQTIQIG